MFERVARIMYRRRWYVIGAWVLVLVVGGFMASQVGSVVGPGEFLIKGTDSYKASIILNREFHNDPQRVLLLVLRNPTVSVSDPRFASTAAKLTQAVQADKPLRVAFVDNPLVTRNSVLLGRDHHSLALLISSKLQEKDIESKVTPLRAITGHVLKSSHGFGAYLTGTAASNRDFAVSSEKDLASGRIVFLLLFIVLLFVFGSVVAAGLPLIQALCSIPLSLAGVFIVAHFISTSIYAINVVEVLGIGVSVDYSLFIVYRFREELQASGGEVEPAVVRTMATTGRAVFFSGVTVAIGLSALILTGVTFMQSMGLAGVLVPVSAVITAMTLMPAVLSVLGTKVNRLKLLPERLLHPGSGGPWHQLAHAIMERPWISGTLAALVLLAAAYPATGLAYSYGSLKNAPKSLESIKGYVYMKNHFPATPDPIEVLARRVAPGKLTSSRSLLDLFALESALKNRAGVRSVLGAADYLSPMGAFTGCGRSSSQPCASINPERLKQITGRYLSPDYKTALIIVVPSSTVGTSQSAATVSRVRSAVDAFETSNHRLTVNVGGAQAEYSDWDNIVLSRFPWIVGIILLVTYCFLFYAFRSAFLPLKAVILNLLSVGAAYGLMQLVFQRGVGSGPLGFVPESGVATWVPIFMFAFLFGLSMDYEVLLLSRIREGWLATADNRNSVAFGLEKTGRLITSAALIMVIAFSAFLIGHQIQLKEFGFGLMVSIAVDASLVRVILVPSIMELMGDRNWWAPKRLAGLAPSRGMAAAGE